MAPRRNPSGRSLVPHAGVLDEGRMGPAMRALNERQRAFVHNMLDQGMVNHTRAALAAGYNGDPDVLKVTAHRLVHDERVQAAVQEEARKRITSGSLMAVNTLLAIAENPVHKDQLKAVGMILDRSGLHALSEHKVTVEQRGGTPAEVVAEIKALATQMGMDPAAFLGRRKQIALTAEPIEDAEYVEVVTGREGLEDLL